MQRVLSANRRRLIAIRLTCLSLVYFALLSVAAGQDVKSPTRLELTPCQVPEVAEKVRCGTYEVFEDRAARKGRKITLKVVVFPATGQTREPDPFVYIPGGPGSSATEDAPGASSSMIISGMTSAVRLLPPFYRIVSSSVNVVSVASSSGKTITSYSPVFGRVPSQSFMFCAPSIRSMPGA